VTDPLDPTETRSVVATPEETATFPPIREEPHVHHEDDDGAARSPLDLRVEKPRTHPLTYAALALGALALILSIAALTRGSGEEFRRVQFGETECVIGEAESDGSDVLYCRAGAPPNG
jgi:hypothetical protein